MVYGQEAILPIELEVPSLRIVVEYRLGDTESLQFRLSQLEKLDEIRAQALLTMEATQKRKKSYYDSKLKVKTFKPNDLVLLYDSRFQHFPGKLQVQWHGPYHVLECFPNGSVQLADFASTQFLTRINGNRLKLYYSQPEDGFSNWKGKSVLIVSITRDPWGWYRLVGVIMVVCELKLLD